MKHKLREYRLKLVILLEPRISGKMANLVFLRLGKKRWVRSEALGFSGVFDAMG